MKRFTQTRAPWRLRCAWWLMAGMSMLGSFGAQAQGDGEVPGELLVQLRATSDLPALLLKHRLSLRAQLGSRPMYRLSVVGHAATRDVAEALALEPSVLSAESNALHRAPEARRNTVWAIGTATQLSSQWALQSLRIPEAHGLSRGLGARVAVLDTGIDANHAIFQGRLLPGHDFIDGDPDPSEAFLSSSAALGHGTHVAGLVALTAPEARIMPLRVLDAQGLGNAWVLGEALMHAVDPDRNPGTPDGVHVINLSLGTGQRTRLMDAIMQLAACTMPPILAAENTFTDPAYRLDRERCETGHGAIVVAAAGNDGSRQAKHFPAAEGGYGLLPITATNPQQQLASFANHGSWVDLAAPGESITSAMAGGGWATWSGTSMAAPWAAGIAALLVAHEPSLTPRDLVRRMTQTSGNLCETRAQRRLDAAATLTGQPASPIPCF